MTDFIDRYVTVSGYEGIAFYVDGYAQRWEPYEYVLVDDDGNEYIEFDQYDGELVDDPSLGYTAHMVGDDRPFQFSADELTPIDEDRVCSCGQLGCFDTWNKEDWNV